MVARRWASMAAGAGIAAGIPTTPSGERAPPSLGRGCPKPEITRFLERTLAEQSRAGGVLSGVGAEGKNVALEDRPRNSTRDDDSRMRARRRRRRGPGHAGGYAGGCTGGRAATDGRGLTAGDRADTGSCRPRRAPTQSGSAPAARRADRALPRSAAQPGADGLDLSARNRRGRSLATRPGQPGAERRCADSNAAAAELGSQREGAGAVPEAARVDGRQARVDAGAR